jgi:hypothetical protein
MAIIRYMWVLLKFIHCMLILCHASMLDVNFWNYLFVEIIKSSLKYIC